MRRQRRNRRRSWALSAVSDGGKKFSVTAGSTIGGLQLAVTVQVTGTFADSDMIVWATLGSQSSPGLTDAGSVTLDATLSAPGGELGYSLTLERRTLAPLEHDDIYVTVAPTGQDAGTNHRLPDALRILPAIASSARAEGEAPETQFCRETFIRRRREKVSPCKADRRG